MSKWIPSREEKYVEMKRKQAAIDVTNLADVSVNQTRDKAFLTIGYIGFNPNGKTDNFIVSLKKKIPIRQFVSEMEKIELELIEIARVVEEEEKRSSG